VEGLRSRGVLNASWTLAVLPSNPLPAWRWTRAMARGELEDLPAVITWGWAASAHLAGDGRAFRTMTSSPSLDLRRTGGHRSQPALRGPFRSTTPGRRPERAVPRSVRKTCGRPSANALTAGLSWWPTRWMRVLGNASWERFARVDCAGNRRRGEYFTVSARLQLQLP
jgi:hypothetical protein